MISGLGIKKKGPLSARANDGSSSAVQFNWSDVFLMMKSGRFAQNLPLNRTLARGVGFMVRRLVEARDTAVEAAHCIKELEHAIQAGEITEFESIPNTLRAIIRRRSEGRTSRTGMVPSLAVPKGVTIAVAQMSALERTAASLYYVESLSEQENFARHSKTPSQFRHILEKARACARLHSAPPKGQHAGPTSVAV
jgi:hypothetical protein